MRRYIGVVGAAMRSAYALVIDLLFEPSFVEDLELPA